MKDFETPVVEVLEIVTESITGDVELGVGESGTGTGLPDPH